MGQPRVLEPTLITKDITTRPIISTSLDESMMSIDISPINLSYDPFSAQNLSKLDENISGTKLQGMNQNNQKKMLLEGHKECVEWRIQKEKTKRWANPAFQYGKDTQNPFQGSTKKDAYTRIKYYLDFEPRFKNLSIDDLSVISVPSSLLFHLA